MSYENQYIRVPNLPNGQIADSDGNPTDDELTFRQALITSLQKNFGDEGLVAPAQISDNVAIIQNNQIPNPVTGIADQYTCGFGRFLYDSTNNRILVSVDGGGGVPAFMEVTLTTPVPPV